MASPKLGIGYQNGNGEIRPTPLQISLAVLMGLPASGKTTLGRKIELECVHQKTVVTLVSYDDFVPHEVQAKCALVGNNLAKQLRKNFSHCVDLLVAELQKCDNDTDLLVSSSLEKLEQLIPPSPETEDLVSNKSMLFKISDSLKKAGDKLLEIEGTRKVILLIDDNNYYSSMRNEFYQIAKTRRTGFCILYCKTSVRTCRQRNSKREPETQVPDKTIVEMSLKLEEPNPLGNVCDSFCVQVHENESCGEEGAEVEEDNIPLILEVLQNSLKHPIDYTPPPDRTQEIEREHRICSESEIHQADQVLRKWVNREMAMPTFMKSKDAKNKQEISRDLNMKRALVLEKLRGGEFHIVAGVHQDVEFSKEVVQLAYSVVLG